MRVPVYNEKGAKTESTVELPKEIFGIKPNLAALRQSIHTYQINQRQGTAATKTRGAEALGAEGDWSGSARFDPFPNLGWRRNNFWSSAAGFFGLLTPKGSESCPLLRPFREGRRRSGFCSEGVCSERTADLFSDAAFAQA